MKKTLAIILIAVFVALLGTSAYFIIDHYKQAEEQEKMYDSLVEIIEESETEPADPIVYSENMTILPELTERYQ